MRWLARLLHRWAYRLDPVDEPNRSGYERMLMWGGAPPKMATETHVVSEPLNYEFPDPIDWDEKPWPACHGGLYL